MESLRSLIALSVQFGLQQHEVDVTNTLLNGEHEEEVYMQQPRGFVVEGWYVRLAILAYISMQEEMSSLLECMSTIVFWQVEIRGESEN